MTMLEYYLVAIFAAVWLVPLAMALRWERRLRAAQRHPVTAETEHEPLHAEGVPAG